jgi:PleD family two-component response regulator
VRKDDLVVRWGGDEFLVILNATDYSHLAVYAKKILSTGLEGIKMEGEDPMKIVVSHRFFCNAFLSWRAHT